jgi:hypothetical protein
MLYQVHTLKVLYVGGKPQTIEKRAHTASSDLEAIRTMKENLHISAPTASGFSLRRMPKDYILGHMWLNLAEAQGDGDTKKARDQLTSLMTPDQIAEAQTLRRRDARGTACRASVLGQRTDRSRPL